MTRSFATGFAAYILLLLACQHGPVQADPFVVPRQTLVDSIETVVVTSVTVEGEIDISDSALTWVETLVEHLLEEAGFSVIPAAEYAEIWAELADEAGGFFDPYTGERDDVKYQAAATGLYDTLRERFAPDALVFPEIWEVDAPYSDGDARWGGTAQMVTGGRGYSGEVLATTLVVAIQDLEGNELYVNETGIQVLEYMVRGRLMPLSPDRVFNDSSWIAAAVTRALRPLSGDSVSTLPTGQR